MSCRLFVLLPVLLLLCFLSVPGVRERFRYFSLPRAVAKKLRVGRVFGRANWFVIRALLAFVRHENGGPSCASGERAGTRRCCLCVVRVYIRERESAESSAGCAHGLVAMAVFVGLCFCYVLSPASTWCLLSYLCRACLVFCLFLPPCFLFCFRARPSWSTRQHHQVKGWIDVTYLSERLRIARGNKGTLFVLQRPPPPPTPASSSP